IHCPLHPLDAVEPVYNRGGAPHFAAPCGGCLYSDSLRQTSSIIPHRGASVDVAVGRALARRSSLLGYYFVVRGALTAPTNWRGTWQTGHCAFSWLRWRSAFLPAAAPAQVIPFQ